MVTLRCTEKLQRRLRVWPVGDGPSSTTVLGDWYGHVVNIRRVRLVLFVSEVSRLGVLLEARDFSTLVSWFQTAVVKLLHQLGIPAKAVEEEERAMKEVVFARTKSRSVLGTINVFSEHLYWAFELRPGLSLQEYSLELSGTIILRPVPGIPADSAKKLMGDTTTFIAKMPEAAT